MIHLQQIIKSSKHPLPIFMDINYTATGKPKPVIIFCHGFKGFKDWGPFNLLADTFASEGFIFIKFNFSHNGTTPQKPQDFTDLEAFGNNNLSIELDDLGDVIDWLESENNLIPEAEIDKNWITLMGHSRGGSICILKGSEDLRIKKIISLAAVCNYESIWEKDIKRGWKKNGVVYIKNSRTNQEMPLYYQLMEDYYHNQPRLHIPTAAKQLRSSLLIIHGTGDESVSINEGVEFKKQNNSARFEKIVGATHTFGGFHPYDHANLPDHLQKVVDISIDFITTKNHEDN